MRVVAVTGGGRGIGRNIANLFRASGDTVVSIDRKASEFNHDLSKPDAAKLLIEEIYQKHGRLDVLVNNARSHLRSKLFEETEEDWDIEMAVNLKSPYFLGKYAIQRMRSGSIVNVGSVTTDFVSHESAAYQISKGACRQLTRVLALAGAPKGIRCNAVLPGFIVQDEYRVRYNQTDNAGYRRAVETCHPIGRPGSSDEVAEAVYYLASYQASFITGQCLTLDGGLTLLDIAAHTLRNPNGAQQTQDREST